MILIKNNISYKREEVRLEGKIEIPSSNKKNYKQKIIGRKERKMKENMYNGSQVDPQKKR